MICPSSAWRRIDDCMLIRVEMPSYNYGVRVKKVCPKDFEINEALWFELYSFALCDDFSNVFKYNTNRLELCKTGKLTKLLEKECVGADEVKFLGDYHKQGFHSSILVERLFIANRFDRRCVRVGDGCAYFVSRNGNEFKVQLSDKVNGQVNVGDLCTITVTANRDWLVTNIVEEDERLSLEDCNLLFGGY